MTIFSFCSFFQRAPPAQHQLRFLFISTLLSVIPFVIYTRANIRMDQQEIDFLRDMPPELTDSVLTYLKLSKWHFKIRQVCKRWMERANISDFSFGAILPADLNEVVDSFNKYTTPIGLDFAKADLTLIRTDHYAPLSKLSNLSSLKIAHQQTTDGRDPTFISALTNLEVLDVQLISTSTIEPLTKLRQLNTTVFQFKEFFPDEAETQQSQIELNLPYLEKAAISAFINTDLPPIFSNAQLTQLTLNKFSRMPKHYLDPHTTSLKTLEINAISRHIHPGIYQRGKNTILINIDTPLPNLESLTTNANISVFDTMQKLTFLEFRGELYSEKDTSLRNVSLLTNLQVLKLRGLQQYPQDLDLSRLTQLSTLLLHRTVFNQDELALNMPILQRLNSEGLKHLCLQLASVKHLPIISKFSSLKNLEISYEYTTDGVFTCDLAPIVASTKLKTLKINGYSTVIKLNQITKLGKLVNLSINAKEIHGLEELNSFKFLTALTVNLPSTSAGKININGLTNLKTFQGGKIIYNKEDLKNITNLWISAPLENWTDLTCMPDLQTFTLHSCALDPEAILYLTALKNLRDLILTETSWHDNMMELSQLRKLKFMTRIPWDKENLPYDPDLVRKKLPYCTF